MIRLAFIVAWLSESAIPAAVDYARTGGLSLYLDAPPKQGSSDPYDITPLGGGN